MNRVADPLLMLIPEAAMGPVILFLFIAGGLALIVGARRAGKALIITAIALPIMSFLFERLMDILFANLPDALVLPVAWATMVATGLMVVWAIIRLIFGQEAITEAKGHLLADAVRAILRRLFTKQALILSILVGFYFWWRVR